MTERDLQIIIGQAINLAHSEHLAGYSNNESLRVDDYIKRRVPELVALILEIRRDVLKKVGHN